MQDGLWDTALLLPKSGLTIYVLTAMVAQIAKTGTKETQVMRTKSVMANYPMQIRWIAMMKYLKNFKASKGLQVDSA